MMKQILQTVCLPLMIVLALSVSTVASASVVDTKEFANETLRLRYLDLIEELRCPKCQNQNLADSNSEIAVDLRRTVRRLLDEGKSDQEITDYLVARYGDFVRYRPPLKSTTWVLWGAPVVLVLLGVVGVLMTRRKRRPEPGRQAGLSFQEQQQLNQILGQTKKAEGNSTDNNSTDGIEIDSNKRRDQRDD